MRCPERRALRSLSRFWDSTPAGPLPTQLDYGNRGKCAVRQRTWDCDLQHSAEAFGASRACNLGAEYWRRDGAGPRALPLRPGASTCAVVYSPT